MKTRRKKVDYEALATPFARIPGVNVEVARDLLDLGFSELHELSGRAPEVLFGNLKDLRPTTPDDRLASFRLVIYFAETPNPDPRKLHPSVWN